MKPILLLLAVALFGLLICPNAQAFTHPGIPLTTDDLDTIKANLNKEPWKSGYAALAADWRSLLSYTMQGPFTYVNRNNGGNYDNENQWKNDMQAIFWPPLTLQPRTGGSPTSASRATAAMPPTARTRTAMAAPMRRSLQRGTNPNNPASMLKIRSMTKSGSDMVVSFPTVSGKTYSVERSGTLRGDSWTTVLSGIPGNGGTVQVTDIGGGAQPRRFYHVVVQQ